MTKDVEAGLVMDRFRSDLDGETHFLKCRIPMPLDAIATHVPRSTSFASNNITFLDLPAGLDARGSRAPERQFVVVLFGEVKVTVSDGESRSWRGGEIFLATDTGTGKGHHTQTIGGPARVLFIPVDDEVDLDAWTI